VILCFLYHVKVKNQVLAKTALKSYSIFLKNRRWRTFFENLRVFPKPGFWRFFFIRSGGVIEHIYEEKGCHLIISGLGQVLA